MTVDLKLLRKEIKIKLHKLSPEERFLSSRKITSKISQSEIFTKSRNIACYIPIENEVDVWPLIKYIWSCEKNCYIPAFSLEEENQLCFVRFEPSDQLINVRYKILEPKVVSEKLIAPQDLDLVIVPLLGFNKGRFRLGRGIGSYDRTFAFKKKAPSSQPYLLGVGYKWQQVKFTPNIWDLVLDDVITE